MPHSEAGAQTQIVPQLSVEVPHRRPPLLPESAPPEDAPPEDAPPEDAPPEDAPPEDAPPEDAAPAAEQQYTPPWLGGEQSNPDSGAVAQDPVEQGP
jgi:hypothetical protein